MRSEGERAASHAGWRSVGSRRERSKQKKQGIDEKAACKAFPLTRGRHTLYAKGMNEYQELGMERRWGASFERGWLYDVCCEADLWKGTQRRIASM